jgi:uncharacterized protein with PIN domain
MNGAGGAPRFFCDAMLGGLARWLRAAGYDASFEHGIDDGDLVRRAEHEGRVVLSSDGGIFLRNVVKHGRVAALFVPRATPPEEQLAVVLARFALPLRDARCMACSGELCEVAKHEVAGEAPPRSFAAFERFWRCASCAKLFWHGTHWRRITHTLGGAARRSWYGAESEHQGRGSASIEG